MLPADAKFAKEALEARLGDMVKSGLMWFCMIQKVKQQTDRQTDMELNKTSLSL